MADTTKLRLRRAAKAALRQGRLLSRGAPDKARSRAGRELHYPEDPEGGAGVREPRRPVPSAPSSGLALDIPDQPQVYLSDRDAEPRTIR